MFLCSQSQQLFRQKHGSGADHFLDFRFEFRQEKVCLSVVNVVSLQVEVSASGLSLLRRSPTKRGVSECDREASIMRRPWPSRR
jgi:hypothetical protein